MGVRVAVTVCEDVAVPVLVFVAEAVCVFVFVGVCVIVRVCVDVPAMVLVGVGVFTGEHRSFIRFIPFGDPHPVQRSYPATAGYFVAVPLLPALIS